MSLYVDKGLNIILVHVATLLAPILTETHIVGVDTREGETSHLINTQGREDGQGLLRDRDVNRTEACHRGEDAHLNETIGETNPQHEAEGLGAGELQTIQPRYGSI